MKHDLALVIGSSVFPYYPYIPGRLLGAETELIPITSDPTEAARAPMGDAIVGDVALALKGLAELVGESDRAPAIPVPSPRSRRRGPDERLAGDGRARRRLAGGRDRGRRDPVEDDRAAQPPAHLTAGSYYFCASGGLGYGISAAVGVQLAQPQRPVVCVLGEGSAQYGITALWTAVAYKLPVTFLVLRNEEYMILKWFSMLEQVTGAPGLDLPGLDVAAVARAYGMPARTVDTREALTEALREDIAAGDGPRLIQARVATGMWMD